MFIFATCVSSSHRQPFSMSKEQRIYYYVYWTYIFAGFWRYETSTRWKMYSYIIYKSIVITAYAIGSTCFFIDAYQVRKDMEKLSFNLTSTVLVMGTLSKITYLSRNIDNLEGIMSSLDNNLNENKVGQSQEDKEIFGKAARQLVYIARIFYLVLILGLPLRILTETASGSKTYLIPIPYKEKLEPFYGIIYTQQVLLVIHFLVTTIAHDMVIFGILLRFIAHFSVIEKNIIKIKNFYPREDFAKYVPGYNECEEETAVTNDVLISKTNGLNKIEDLLVNYGFDKVNAVNWVNDKEARERKINKMLRDIIQHHQKLLREIRTFFRIYSPTLLVQMVFAVFLIVVVVIQIILLSSKLSLMLAQQIIYIGTTMMNLLCLCNFGTGLTTKSCDAANALYDTPWYNMNSKNRYIVNFTLKKFIIAPKVEGGKMVSINRESYLKLLQNSYNMVAVLRNVS